MSTVDAFQGAEKSIIILSTVRTKSIGFIDNKRSFQFYLNEVYNGFCYRRVNVALTRAKRHLFILGNEQLLRSNELWREIVQNQRKSLLLINFNHVYFSYLAFRRNYPYYS